MYTPDQPTTCPWSDHQASTNTTIRISYRPLESRRNQKGVFDGNRLEGRKKVEKVEVLRMGFAVVVAAVVVEPRRFGRGNWCLHFPKALVRNESRRTASPKKELGWERGSKSSRKIVEKKKFSEWDSL